VTSRTRSRAAVGQARRTRPVRRNSPRLSPVRAGAALAMLASAAAVYGVGASPAFEAVAVDLAGIRYSDETELRRRLAIPEGTNLFGLATDSLEARLLEVPTVARASVSVRLPGTVVVEIDERDPILVWQVGERRLLTDRDGTLFAPLPARPGSEAAALPVVVDRRAPSAEYGVGSRLDPVDLDAATRLASLRPVDVGSAATSLAVELSDEQGFVLLAARAGWSAVFGFYTPSLRTPEMIPSQVRLLASLLLERGERNVQRVVLASETDGTFTTPLPTATAR